MRSGGVGDAGHLSGGSGVQTTHSFHGGHPADGNCWSLEGSQRARDERLPSLLMNHSPLRHLGPLQHKLYLHLLKALGRFIEAAVLSLPAPRGNVTVNICLGEMRPADEGFFCGQRDDSSLVTYSPCCWPMAQTLSPPGAKARPQVSQQSPEVTLISTLSLGWGAG